MSNSQIVPTVDSIVVKFESKIEHFSRTLKGLDRIIAFVENERSIWEGLRSASVSVVSDHITYYREILRHIQGFQEAADESSRLSNFNALVHLGSRGYTKNINEVVIFSKMRIAADLFQMLSKGLPYAAGVNKWLKREAFETRRDDVAADLLTGFIDAQILFMREELVGRTATKEHREQYAELLESIKAEHVLQQRHSDNLKEATEALLQESHSQLALELDQSRARHAEEKEFYDADLASRKQIFEDLRLSYKEHMRLKKPSELWQTTAATYRNQGRNWVWAVVASSVFSVIILLLVILLAGDHLDRGLTDPETGNIDTGGVRIFFLLVTMVSIMAYLIRLTAKLALSSFHMHRDAEEREALTVYYLALIQENAITEAHRPLLLQSLFSRTETGLLGRSDSKPTMPSLDPDLLQRASSAFRSD